MKKLLLFLVSVFVTVTVNSQCPDSNHPHMIDLGLPSGTKWACCNVGASSPEGYGDYYAWGETKTKSKYNRSTYTFLNRKDLTCNDIGENISNTQYDVAHVKWGAPWRLPTIKDINELLDNCTDTWTKLNGVRGNIITSKRNGGSIFLPATGVMKNEELEEANTDGYFWSGSMANYRVDEAYYNAYHIYARNGSTYWGYHNRFYGYTVRPVAK